MQGLEKLLTAGKTAATARYNCQWWFKENRQKLEKVVSSQSRKMGMRKVTKMKNKENWSRLWEWGSVSPHWLFLYLPYMYELYFRERRICDVVQMLIVFWGERSFQIKRRKLNALKKMHNFLKWVGVDLIYSNVSNGDETHRYFGE